MLVDATTMFDDDRVTMCNVTVTVPSASASASASASFSKQVARDQPHQSFDVGWSSFANGKVVRIQLTNGSVFAFNGTTTAPNTIVAQNSNPDNAIADAKVQSNENTHEQLVEQVVVQLQNIPIFDAPTLVASTDALPAIRYN